MEARKARGKKKNSMKRETINSKRVNIKRKDRRILSDFSILNLAK
jgi:hypothetical protein